MKSKAANPVDLMFRAIADPTRLRILGLLRNGERCVCELVDILRCPQPKASRHLGLLASGRIGECPQGRTLELLPFNTRQQSVSRQVAGMSSDVLRSRSSATT